MDKTKTTYLLVAVNIAVGVFVVIFLIVALMSKNTDADPSNQNNGRGMTATGSSNLPPRFPPGLDPTAQPPRGIPAVEVPTLDGPRVVSTNNRPPSITPREIAVEQTPVEGRDTNKNRRKTVQLLKQLQLLVELYKSRHGSYPPSHPDASEFTGGNERNEGVENLYAHLAATGLLRYGSLTETGDAAADRWFGNTDGDAYAALFKLGDTEFRGDRLEILDSWGNPLIYFRNGNYAATAAYVIDGDEQVATPQISQVTGKYHAEHFVMIWSAGPNGVNEDGAGDDVTSWHIRE